MRVFIRGRANECVSSQLGSVSVTYVTCVCLYQCLSERFSGLNARTVPQLCLNKFRAPLGYRGLVPGLKVSSFR